MGFFPRGSRGTMRGPAKFNPMASSIKLFRAMRGLGADKQAITEVFAAHNAQQRGELKLKYKYVYKKDLAQVLNDELSYSFGKLVGALMMEPEDLVMECIHRTLMPKSTGRKLVRRLSQIFSNGLCKDEFVLIDLLCYKSNQYLQALKEAYKEKYDEDLDEMLANEGGHLLSQDFRNIIQDMLSCERDENEKVDDDQLNDDVNDLMDDDCPEVALQSIFQERSYPHIRRVFVEYRKKSGKMLAAWIEENPKFSAEQKGTYIAIYNKIRNESQFYAERLRTAIDGMGRDDDALIRIVVLRSELDLLDIMQAYKDKYDIELQTNVAKETSGDYKELLTKIIQVPDESDPIIIDPTTVHLSHEDAEDVNLDENALKALLEDDNDEDGGKKDDDDEEEDEDD